MEQRLQIDVKDIKKLDSKTLNSVLDKIAKKAREILTDNITQVYLINSKIRVNENYAPLEEMLQAIKVDYNRKNMSFSIGIDEDFIDWKDKFGEDIYEVETDQKGEETVSSLEQHWKTPIRGVKEDDWFLEKTVEELSSFIKKNFVKMI